MDAVSGDGGVSVGFRSGSGRHRHMEAYHFHGSCLEEKNANQVPFQCMRPPDPCPEAGSVRRVNIAAAGP
jgi:hypothetical protein